MYSLFLVPVLSAAMSIAPDDQTAKTFFPKALDMSVPRLSAVSLLGLDASKAGSPTTFNSFVTSYVRGRDVKGILEEGVAFGWSFQQLGLGTNIQASDVQNIISGNEGAMKSQRTISGARLRNTPMLSLAALRAEEGYSRASVSISVALIDKSDWRYDVKENRALFKKFESIAAKIANAEASDPTSSINFAVDPVNSVSVLKEFATRPSVSKELTDKITAFLAGGELTNEAYNKALAADIRDSLEAAAVKEGTKLAETRSKEQSAAKTYSERFVVAFAGTGLARDDDNSTKFDGSFAWLSYERPAFGGGLTLFSKGYQHDTRYDSKTKTFTTSGGYDLGLKYRVADKGGTSAFFAEGLYSEKRSPKMEASRTFQVGYEAKVGEQWLQVGFGPTFTEGKTLTLFGINLKWNFSTAPELVKG